MSQKHEEFETPERGDIRGIMEDHIVEMEASDADDVWIKSGMHHLLLQMKGRKSGKQLKVALPFWLDANDFPLVVASYSGAPHHPAWFHNLADTSANPDIAVRIQQTRYRARVEILDGDDYTSNWAALTADRDFYQDYQDQCERRIPLVRLIKIEDV